MRVDLPPNSKRGLVSTDTCTSIEERSCAHWVHARIAKRRYPQRYQSHFYCRWWM